MLPSFSITQRARGFSLIELLSVMAIIAVLAGMMIPALSQGDAKKFTSTVNDFTTILEQARTSAMAMNTHVWVGFRPASGSGETGVAVTAVASRSGEADTSTSNLQLILPPRMRSSVVFDNNLPAIADTENLDAGNMSFVQRWRGSDVTFDSVIRFNPRGEATLLQGAQSRWIQFGLIAAKGNVAMAANNATIRLSGVTGQVVVSRP